MFDAQNLILACLLAAGVGAEAAVEFERDIKPLLEAKCLSCHNPNTAKGKVSLHSAQSLMEHPDLLVVAGKPLDSLLLEVISPGSDGSATEMPEKGDPLNPEEVERAREWIASGAAWPDGRHLPIFDQPTAALLTDLKQRGLMDDTIVLWKTEFGCRAQENPTTIWEFYSTVLHLLGLDYERLSYYHNGFDRRLTDVHGHVIRELLA